MFVICRPKHAISTHTPSDRLCCLPSQLNNCFLSLQEPKHHQRFKEDLAVHMELFPGKHTFQKHCCYITQFERYFSTMLNIPFYLSLLVMNSPIKHNLEGWLCWIHYHHNHNTAKTKQEQHKYVQHWNGEQSYHYYAAVMHWSGTVACNQP